MFVIFDERYDFRAIYDFGTATPHAHLSTAPVMHRKKKKEPWRRHKATTPSYSHYLRNSLARMTSERQAIMPPDGIFNDSSVP